MLLCRDCLHQARADYGALIAAGRGDVALIELRWRCAACGGRRVSGVVCGARWAGYLGRASPSTSLR